MESFVVLCHIGGQKFGISLTVVRTVQKTAQLRRNEQVDGPFGWLMAGRHELPIYDAARALGLQAQQPLINQRVIIIQDEAGWWGVLVDDVEQAMKPSKGYLLPETLQSPENHYFNRLLIVQESPLLELIPTYLRPDHPQRGKSAIFAPSFTGVPAIRPSHPQLLVCGLPAIPYTAIGLSSMQIVEIINLTEWVVVPTAPTGILGCFVWREYLLPIIDMAKWLGVGEWSATDKGRQRLIIVHTADRRSLLAFPITASLKNYPLPVRHTTISQAHWPTSPHVRHAIGINQQMVIIPQWEMA